MRFPWPTRQEISFFLYEDLFWIILGWHFMRFLRCSAHGMQRYSYCSGWLAIGSNCRLYKCIRLLLWASMIYQWWTDCFPEPLLRFQELSFTIRQFSVNLNPHLGMICHDQWAISIHEFGFNLELIPNTQIYSLLGSYASFYQLRAPATDISEFKVEWGGLLTKRSWSGQPCHPTLDAWTWTKKNGGEMPRCFQFSLFLMMATGGVLFKKRV